MRKIFTLAAAVLASMAMMAGDLALETYNWAKNCSFADTITTRNGVTLFTDASAWKGNIGGMSYISCGGGCDMTNPSNYFGISIAEGALEAVEIYWAPNGTDASNIAWAGWAKEADKLKQVTDAIGETAEYIGEKKLESAIWQRIEFGENDFQAVLITRQLKKVKVGEGGDAQQIGKNKTVNILGVRVYTKVTKEAKDTTYTLTSLAVNGEEVTAEQLNTLISTKALALADSYVEAPELAFTEKMVITYVDETTKESTKVYKETMKEVEGAWSYTAAVGENSYTVTAAKAASYTVIYMDGATKLGEEVVAANGKVAEYAQYEAQAGATFVGWFTDPELTIAADLDAAITANSTLYGKWEKAYFSKSVNIEQDVLDYGTKFDIQSELTAAGIWYENLNDLDTLNDLENKANRNYAFLGLKIKTKGGYLATNLKANGMILVKFGNVGGDVKFTLKGATTDATYTFTAAQIAASDNVLPVYGYTEDIMIKMETTSDKTVVIKQIMMDEIAEVVLPAPSAYLVTCAEAENGKVEVTWPNKKYRTPVSETVTITATPAEGYEIASVTVDGELLEAVEGAYSFVMPAKEVTVAATFSIVTALENVDASKKAVKVVIDGQLYIKKGDKLYNALGSMIQ